MRDSDLVCSSTVPMDIVPQSLRVCYSAADSIASVKLREVLLSGEAPKLPFGTVHAYEGGLPNSCL